MPDVFPNLRWKVPYRSSMQKTTLSFLPIAFLVQIIGATCLARAQAEKARYPAMAPLDLYLAPDQIPRSRWLAVLLPHPFRTPPK